jgi:hypothetical protein
MNHVSAPRFLQKESMEKIRSVKSGAGISLKNTG